MFFPEKITNIKPEYQVLEIGPGAHPFHRSDVLLELEYKSEEDKIAQFGHTEKLNSDKKIVFYDGTKFPFADNEFDYVICSHVLEHVPDVQGFITEIFRVSKHGGYFEYPLIYYDYLYNINVHVNFLKFDGKTLKYYKKEKTPLSYFQPVQNLLTHSLKNGYVGFVNEMLPYLMEGFEWSNEFNINEAQSINEVVHADFKIPKLVGKPDSTNMDLIKQVLWNIFKR
ncbi:MAG: class I SAM-dependent methyltransferase [Bacteroidia bacterium]|nr:class I SAM-dependent methyltransferase [Bacteroidia bacterium]